MLPKIRAALLVVIASYASSAVAADPRVVSEKRLLTDDDLGKVFVTNSIAPHPSFGKYKVLLSTHTKGLYAFETFDLIGGEPVGNFIVSHPAEAIYREVSVDPVTMGKARREIQKANARLRELLLQR